MSFIAAVLILNLDTADAFIAFSNLLNKPCQMAFFRVDHGLVSIPVCPADRPGSRLSSGKDPPTPPEGGVGESPVKWEALGACCWILKTRSS